MVVYYINRVSESLADHHYPIKEGDICMLYDGEVVKTIYIDSEIDEDSIWRDFKFVDTKSLKSYHFPKSDCILCAPVGSKQAIGNTSLLTQMIQECKGEWLLDFLNETSAVLSGFVDYWDLKILRRFTGDDNVATRYEKQEVLREFLESAEENEDIDEYDEEEIDVDDADILPKSYDVKWFCLSALACIEGELNNRSYRILTDMLNGASRSEMAARYGLSQERIRQIVVKATKQAKELLIEQRKSIDETKNENALLKAKLKLLREEIINLKVLLPKEELNRLGDENKEMNAELVVLFETPINELDIPVRAVNILKNMGVVKFVDIPQIESYMRLLKERNSGMKTVQEISRMLDDFHLSFGMSYTDIFNTLKAKDWHNAKRKWIRGNKNSIESSVDETDAKQDDILQIEDIWINSDPNFHIKHQGNSSYIIDNDGIKVFSTSGKLIFLDGVYYRVSYTYSYISVNIIKKDERNHFVLGKRIIDARRFSSLYRSLLEDKYIEQILSIRYDRNTDAYYIHVGEKWYDSSGNNSDLIFSKNYKEEQENIDENTSKNSTLKDSNELEAESEQVSFSRYILRVKYPDGRVFSSNRVWETLVDVVKYAGPEKVRQLNIQCLGDNLVTPYYNMNPAYRAAQRDVGRGLYVNTFSSTDIKLKQIETINDRCQLGLKVDKVNVVKVVTDTPDNTEKEIVKVNNVSTKVDKRIGYTVRLFPSQQKGEIVNVYVDNKGIKKIVVRKGNGKLAEIDDLPYLYEVIKRR